MKVKVYKVLWSFFYRGEVDCGCSLHTDRKKALSDLKSCYKQAIINLTPSGKVSELDIDEFDSDEENAYYYLERYAADAWEKGEIVEDEIEV